MFCLQIEAVEIFWNILDIEIGMSVPKTAKFFGSKLQWSYLGSYYWILYPTTLIPVNLKIGTRDPNDF